MFNSIYELTDTLTLCGTLLLGVCPITHLGSHVIVGALHYNGTTDRSHITPYDRYIYIYIDAYSIGWRVIHDRTKLRSLTDSALIWYGHCGCKKLHYACSLPRFGFSFKIIFMRKKTSQWEIWFYIFCSLIYSYLYYQFRLILFAKYVCV